MKKYMFLLFVMGCSLFSAAQDKAALTKQETVNYINKKMKEIDGHYRTVIENNKKYKFYYREGESFDFSGQMITYTYHRSGHKSVPASERIVVNNKYVYSLPCDYYINDMTSKFDPAHIKSIEEGTTYVQGEPVGSIKITLVGKVGTFERLTYETRLISDANECYDYGPRGNEKNSVSEVTLMYLKSDPANFNKIKKALEHLRDLCKAEDDPFGE